jgi:hypothetical protein
MNLWECPWVAKMPPGNGIRGIFGDVGANEEVRPYKSKKE